jgi:hypothetical protein
MDGTMGMNKGGWMIALASHHCKNTLRKVQNKGNFFRTTGGVLLYKPSHSHPCVCFSLFLSFSTSFCLPFFCCFFSGDSFVLSFYTVKHF